MFREEILSATSYLSIFDESPLSDESEEILREQAVDGVVPVTLHSPQAVLLSDIDPAAYKAALSFMGRLCWDKDWNRDPDKFIELIIDRGHESVLEHAPLSFLVLGNRAMTHQLVRHRVGMSFTQQSQRYISYGDPSKSVPVVLPHGLSGDEEAYYLDGALLGVNQYRLGTSFMKQKAEFARLNLPNSCGTIIGVTLNPRSLRHFLRERMHKGAQSEIRAVANDMYDAVESAGLEVLLKGLDHLKEFDPRQ